MRIVAIGASAGGIEALQLFFQHMPSENGMAFIVIVHLPVDRKSMLADIIGKWTRMTVLEAVDDQALRPDTIHVITPGMIATCVHGHLRLRRLAPNVPREPTPIDTFFDSLAADQGENATGIVLSGTGHDGSLGLKAIKARNGFTMAQGMPAGDADGSAPSYDGMPASAIATGAVDLAIPVERMPERLIHLRGALEGDESVTCLPAKQIDAARLRICTILQERLSHDFSQYKEKTFLRRVQRRMHVLGVDALDEYVTRLEASNDEAVLLFRDLLIGVTTFFRDAAAFDAVKTSVMPRLFDNKGANDTVRVWVAGCATGEEAYSMSMLLCEQMDTLTHPPRVQIFATDIDELAIDTARAGRYPATLVEGLSPERLRRFFVRTDSGFAVNKEIRDLCTFSAHSLVRDPPFSRLDMVSCRNLLIYLDADLQASIIPAFHYALVPGGVLLLGSSETVVRHEGLFAALDKERRIFIRRDGPAAQLRVPNRVASRTSIGKPTPATNPRAGEPGKDQAQGVERDAARLGSPEHRTNWAQVIGQANGRVLERFATPFAVIAADGTLIHYSSHVGHFLLPALGAPSRSVFDMVRKDLRLALRGALRDATATSRSVEVATTTQTDEGAAETVTMVLEPLPGAGGERIYLLVFKSRVTTSAPLDAPPELRDHHAQMENEIRNTREQLQSLSEEHQTALEELRSSNEELHSVNEELQSANEELETSKEEIQSINEELQTVNAQLSSKVDELNRANSDLRNLFESTRVATIFLDQGAIIRAFTPEVCSIYNLIPSDRGRPLTDIVSRLSYDHLGDDMRSVLQTLQAKERRVSRTDGSAHYLLRILPYREPDSTVDGTLITFVDVTSIVKAEQHQRLLVDELNHRVKNMLAVVISLATQSLRRAPTLEAFSEVFLGRVHALASAYALLSRENWSTVVLRDVINEELKPYMSSDRANIRFQGPDAALEPRSALALGMAIHELATNAVKYGALSVPEGDLTVEWNLERTDDGTFLSLDWQEIGGPLVSPPAKRGFGTTLVERGITHDLAGEARIDFRPEGVRATLRVPVTAPKVSAALPEHAPPKPGASQPGTPQPGTPMPGTAQTNLADPAA